VASFFILKFDLNLLAEGRKFLLLKGGFTFGRRFDYYLLCMKSEAAFTLTEPSFVLLKTSSILIFFFSVSIDYLTLFDFWPMVLLNTNGLLYDEVNYD